MKFVEHWNRVELIIYLFVFLACSLECETNFISCVDSKDTSTALKRTQAFEKCIKVTKFTNLNGCVESCAPTFNMMATSEMPTTREGGFGAVELEDFVGQKPSESLCTNPGGTNQVICYSVNVL